MGGIIQPYSRNPLPQNRVDEYDTPGAIVEGLVEKGDVTSLWLDIILSNGIVESSASPDVIRAGWVEIFGSEDAADRFIFEHYFWFEVMNRKLQSGIIRRLDGMLASAVTTLQANHWVGEDDQAVYTVPENYPAALMLCIANLPSFYLDILRWYRLGYPLDVQLITKLLTSGVAAADIPRFLFDIDGEIFHDAFTPITPAS
jgi:hypothetical protein